MPLQINCIILPMAAPLQDSEGEIDMFYLMMIIRDAIFPDFSGIPDFYKSKLSMTNL